ncbi:response regulator [Halobacteriovorax sp. HLS]|uniref:response regulator n=1 Tax=Halobacteriovorax sp. HLS TaxID=2234000 RepID=UPI000FD6D6B5|nr:response regulator [Halobacteriovorax sp. HLS]
MQKRILLIDDELDLLELMKESLVKLGHSVDCLTDPLQALRKFYDESSLYSCVIIDYQLPRMDGVELALHMMEILPNIPIILTTGYADERIHYLLSKHRNILLLEKPFKLNELVFLMTQVVGRGNLRVSA